MEPTVAEPPLKTPELTTDQAEAWGIVLKHVEPFFEKHHAHVERLNEQARHAAFPMFCVAGVIVATVSAAALWAVWNQDAQLTRDLLLPLLSFAGGLGIGRSVTQKP